MSPASSTAPRHRGIRCAIERRTVSQVPPSVHVGLDPGDLLRSGERLRLLHQVITAQLAARRSRAPQSTKTRCRGTSGGSAKPYRQKGTGNARRGSIRALRTTRGAGVALGPKPHAAMRSATPRKMVQAGTAVRSLRASSDQADPSRLDQWAFSELPKTRDAVAALTALSSAPASVVIVLDAQ